MKKIVILICVSILSVLLVSCDSKTKKKVVKERIVTAQLQTPTKHLYFTGTIQPIKTVSVLSPADGRIEELNFIYGQDVKKGQLLAVVNSLALMDKFRQAVSSYLQKKTDYLTKTQDFEGAKVLYKAGVIDQQDFIGEKNSFENTVLDFYGQEYELKKVLLKAGVNIHEIEKLNISDTKKIQALFARQFNHLHVYAPTAGVALFPLPQDGQSNNSDSDSSGQLIVGSKVREAQLILSIGDLAGFSIDMNVSEVNVNSLRKGMKAIISGDAFPGIQMDGDISYVASQAQPSQGGDSSAALFKVSVDVPRVIDKELLSVHVGMTAKVDIPIKGTPRVMVPINAVFKKNGGSYVTVVDAGGKHQDVAVITGSTTPSAVAIVSGLKNGQKVVVRDQV